MLKGVGFEGEKDSEAEQEGEEEGEEEKDGGYFRSSTSCKSAESVTTVSS